MRKGKRRNGQPAGTRTRKDSLGGYRDILFHHGLIQRRTVIVTKNQPARKKISILIPDIPSKKKIPSPKFPPTNTTRNKVKNIFHVKSLIYLYMQKYFKYFSQKYLQTSDKPCNIRVS